MNSLNLSNIYTVLLPPPPKKRDLTWWGLLFTPLNTLQADTPQWASIIGDLYKSAAAIKALSMLIIESSKKLAINTNTSAQFLRAQYRLWLILRLAREYTFTKDTLLQIVAAEAAFDRIHAHFYPPPPPPSYDMTECPWDSFELSPITAANSSVDEFNLVW